MTGLIWTRPCMGLLHHQACMWKPFYSYWKCLIWPSTNEYWFHTKPFSQYLTGDQLRLNFSCNISKRSSCLVDSIEYRFAEDVEQQYGLSLAVKQTKSNW